MLTILEPSHIVECVRYEHEYHWKNDPGSGFAFLCDEKGIINRADWYPEGIANLDYCLADQRKPEGEQELIDQGIITSRWSYVESARARCHCGNEMMLDGDSIMGECSCSKCGRVYNTSGQELVGVTRPWAGANDCGEYYDASDY